MMKKKILMIVLSTVLIMSGCGQEAAESTGESATAVESSTEQMEAASAAVEEKESADKESAVASGAATTEQSSEKASVETQKESEKADKAEATATPEATQKPEAEKETKATEKPATTAAPAATKAPVSTPKADKSQTSTGSTQTNTGSNQSSAGNATQSKPTSAPVSAPVVSAPTPEPHTQCTWDGGSVTQNASCASEGTATYTCTVCGNTKTESIARTSHNYVTETTEATCTTGGSSKTYCSNCGDVQSETTTGGGLGHDFYREYFNNRPTCSGSVYYMNICSRCGASGGDGTEPPLGHSPVSEEVQHGDCVTFTVIVTTCSSCGMKLDETGHYEDEGHDWVVMEEQVLNHATLEYETNTYTICTKCEKIQ